MVKRFNWLIKAIKPKWKKKQFFSIFFFIPSLFFCVENLFDVTLPVKNNKILGRKQTKKLFLLTKKKRETRISRIQSFSKCMEGITGLCKMLVWILLRVMNKLGQMIHTAHMNLPNLNMPTHSLLLLYQIEVELNYLLSMNWIF